MGFGRFFLGKRALLGTKGQRAFGVAIGVGGVALAGLTVDIDLRAPMQDSGVTSVPVGSVQNGKAVSILPSLTAKISLETAGGH